jgi:RNA polymerase primary sigma factor
VSHVAGARVSHPLRGRARATGPSASTGGPVDVFDRALDDMASRGRERGFVTSEELLAVVPEDRLSTQQLEEFIAAIEASLHHEGIDVVEVHGGGPSGDEPGGSLAAVPADTQSLDPIRMYVGDIGKAPLLTAAEEVDLAMRIEAGVAAGELLSGSGLGEFARRAKFRGLCSRVVDIRERQLDPASRLVRRGVGLETISRSYRPGGGEQMTGFLERVRHDGRVARNSLIVSNLRLVVSIAKRYVVTPGTTLLDLTQEGNLGLIHAVEKFDHTRGFKFSTYATWWIRQSVLRALSSQGRVIRTPAHVAELLYRMRRSRRRLTQALGREPVSEEIGRDIGISAARVREIQEATREPVSIQTPIGTEGDGQLGDLVEDRSATEAFDRVAVELLHADLRSVLQTLDPREERVVLLRFGLLDGRPRTLGEIGLEFGLTRERIRQIEGKAMAKLRHPSRKQPLRGYLA